MKDNTIPFFKDKKIIVYLFLYIITLGIIFSTFILKPNESVSFPLLRTIIILFACVLLTKYFLYMLISPWYDVQVAYFRKKHRKKIANYRPLVSIMIPAWNESKGLLFTVKSLLKSTYRNIQIIVVNDGSTDDSHQLMEEFVHSYYRNPQQLHDIEIAYLYKKNSGKGHTLNTAIDLSKGDIIMSVDADCIVDKEAVQKFVEYFADPTVMAAVGNVKIGNTKNLIGMIQSLEFLFSFYFKKAQSITNTIYIIGGAAGAFRREVFESIGKYDSNIITEDIELSLRIQDNGMKIVYAADAIIYTEGASEIKGLMKQRLRWKRGRFETFFNYPYFFFSIRKRHNKLLSCIILPLELFGELQLFLEVFFIIFLYIFSYFTRDFSSFISGVIVVASMFVIQAFFDEKKTRSASFYFLAPVGWLLFYVTTSIEWSALARSILGLVRKKELKWQKWERKGILDKATEDKI